MEFEEEFAACSALNESSALYLMNQRLLVKGFKTMEEMKGKTNPAEIKAVSQQNCSWPGPSPVAQFEDITPQYSKEEIRELEKRLVLEERCKMMRAQEEKRLAKNNSQDVTSSPYEPQSNVEPYFSSFTNTIKRSQVFNSALENYRFQRSLVPSSLVTKMYGIQTL